jgi:AcrR family transcriptional regulator
MPILTGMAFTDRTVASESRSRSWKQDPAAVQADILRAARIEFAAHGLAGTRVQDIADRTQTSKRMIFYYYTDKEGLYRAVLEDAYRRVREGEAALDLDGLSPVEALRRLVEFTFDYHRANPEFIRLVMIENIHYGRHMRSIATLSKTGTAAIDQLTRICAAGREAGLFREDVSPLSLHWQISAMSFFNVSNRATFSLVFGEELYSAEGQDVLREQAVRSILSTVLRDV